MSKKRLDKQKAKDLGIQFGPQLLALIVKLIKFRKGGYSKEERHELGEDLLSLGLSLLAEAKPVPEEV